MIYKSMFMALKRGLTMRKYPTADRNASFTQLFLHAIPYLLSRSGYSLPPLSVFIHVNTRCNLRCKFCDAGQDDQGSMFYKNLKGGVQGDMPLENFKKIIDRVKHFKPFIGIPALEPILYPHLFDALRYIKKQGLRSSIATNGTLLEEKARGFMEAGLTKIVISLDGPERIHDEIRGVPGTYQKVIAGIKKLNEFKSQYGHAEPYVYINYVITEDNFDTLQELVESLPLEVIDQVDFRVMFYCTQELAEKHNEQFGYRYDATSACLAGGIDLKNVDTNVLYEQAQAITYNYKAKCKFFFNHGKEELRKYYHESEVFLDDTRCVFPWYTLQIDTDGSVIPPQRCYHNVFGNILEQDYEEIWNGEKMRQFRRDLRKYGRFPACTRCEGVNF